MIAAEHYGFFFMVGLIIVAAIVAVTYATDFVGDQISRWKAGAGVRRLAKHGRQASKDLS